MCRRVCLATMPKRPFVQMKQNIKVTSQWSPQRLNRRTIAPMDIAFITRDFASTWQTNSGTILLKVFAVSRQTGIQSRYDCKYFI